jgi:hypothetical protein
MIRDDIPSIWDHPQSEREKSVEPSAGGGAGPIINYYLAATLTSLVQLLQPSALSDEPRKWKKRETLPRSAAGPSANALC